MKSDRFIINNLKKAKRIENLILKENNLRKAKPIANFSS
ncbi:hypothetical protein CLCAR_2521 [Clostridium carboxidivorans P7]|nr:hypothetical protein CLCAR_2521 [Clostridium carboxidivorans P7]